MELSTIALDLVRSISTRKGVSLQEHDIIMDRRYDQLSQDRQDGENRMIIGRVKRMTNDDIHDVVSSGGLNSNDAQPFGIETDSVVIKDDVIADIATQGVDTLSDRLILTDCTKVRLSNMPFLTLGEYGKNTPSDFTLGELRIFFNNFSDSNKIIFLNAIQINFPEFSDNRIYPVTERIFYSESGIVISLLDYLKQPSALKIASYPGI